jgi:hypothetical protein
VFEKKFKIKRRNFFQSEKRYHTLTEVLQLGIFRTGLRLYDLCQSAGLKFQACPIKGIGNGWLDAVHEEDRKAILYRWKNATGKSEKTLSEYRFVKPDGTIAGNGSNHSNNERL